MLGTCGKHPQDQGQVTSYARATKGWRGEKEEIVKIIEIAREG